MYARKPGGKWECVFDGPNSGDYDFYIDGDYVEFGFEFDITGGCDWPYSDVFWDTKKSEEKTVEDIHIRMEGSAGGFWFLFGQPSLSIGVNHVMAVDKANLESGARYDWD